MNESCNISRTRPIYRWPQNIDFWMSEFFRIFEFRHSVLMPQNATIDTYDFIVRTAWNGTHKLAHTNTHAHTPTKDLHTHTVHTHTYYAMQTNMYACILAGRPVTPTSSTSIKCRNKICVQISFLPKRADSCDEVTSTFHCSSLMQILWYTYCLLCFL